MLCINRMRDKQKRIFANIFNQSNSFELLLKLIDCNNNFRLINRRIVINFIEHANNSFMYISNSATHLQYYPWIINKYQP